MNAKVLSAFVVMVVVGVVSAGRRPSYGYAPRDYSASFESSEESYESSEAKYDFSWSVDDDSSENHYGHQESRDGDHTEGSYYVQLPDGRLQKVTYYVDGDSGYVADVSYEGEARYPDSYESGSYESGSSESGSSESGSYEASRRYGPPRKVYG